MKSARERKEEYEREWYTIIRLMFNTNADADVIKHLAGFSNKTAYIKSLILHDIDSRYPLFRDEESNPHESPSVTMKLHKTNDQDVIKRLMSVPNKRDYISTLIRSDISGEITESWKEISNKTDLNGLLMSLAMVTENLDDVSGQIADSAKRAVIDTLKSQIGDALRIINSGLDLA